MCHSPIAGLEATKKKEDNKREKKERGKKKKEKENHIKAIRKKQKKDRLAPLSVVPPEERAAETSSNGDIALINEFSLRSSARTRNGSLNEISVSMRD